MNYELLNVLNLKNIVRKSVNNWKEIEQIMNFVFPNDYKDFIDSFGCGCINDFLWILSPFVDNDNLNIVNKFIDIKSAYLRQYRTKIAPQMRRQFFRQNVQNECR